MLKSFFARVLQRSQRGNSKHPDTDKGLSDQEKAFQQCLLAFVEHHYDSCVRQSTSLISNGVATLELLQILLISLQRLGKTDELEAWGAQCLKMSADHPWDNALFKLTLGEIDASQVMAMAKYKGQASQAYCYSGTRMETLGYLDAAQELFDKCLELCREIQLLNADYVIAVRSHENMDSTASNSVLIKYIIIRYR